MIEEMKREVMENGKERYDVTEFMNEMLSSDFFSISCNFTEKQCNPSNEKRCLLESMMLLDINYISGFLLKDFSENTVLAYYKNIREHYDYRQRNTLRSAIQYLENAFPVRNKNICEMAIPMLVYLADVAQYEEIKPEFFEEWWNYFIKEDAFFDVYKTFCTSDSSKLENIKGRFSIMVKSFCKYFQVELPEELLDMVAEVEKELDEKKKNEI